MGIQINGNNDIISALDGSWTAEGASINTSGILTATTFKGNIVGTAATFTGPVTIGGTLTYEDVTNIDSVGIITARDGLKILGGGANVVGVVTASAGIVDSTLTAGRVVYVDSDKSLTDSANLTWDATTFKVQAATPALEISGTNSNGGNSSLYFNANANHWVLEADNYTQQNIFSIKSGTTASSTPRLSIDSTGKVGIGTATPSEILTAHTASGNTKQVLSSHAGFSELDFVTASTLRADVFANASEFTLTTRTAIPIVFRTNGTNERLRITSTGQITQTNFNGIGFHMSGGQDPSIRIQDTDGTNQYADFAHNGGDSYIVTRNNTSHGVFRVYSNNGSETKNRLVIDANGHFGIGRSSGLELLDIKGVDDDALKFSASTYGGGHLRITGADETIAGSAGPYNHTTRFKTKPQNNNGGNGAESDALVLYHDGWSGLNVASFPNCSVGINETNPTSRLVVDAGTTSNTTACQLKNDSTSAYAINDGGINNCLSLQSTGTNAAQSVGLQFSLDKSGETGCISEIGATRESNGNSTLVFRTRDSSTGRNERLRIDANGKLLIGKTRTQYTNDYYDDITINNSGGSGAAGGTGITMISNSSSWGALQFGDQDDHDGGYIKYDHNQDKMIFGIEDGSVRFWQTKAKTWFGTTGHGDGSRSTLFDLVGENQDPAAAWGQMGIYSSTAQAQDKGGSITFGGQDGTTARQYFAGIQGAKENGTGGNYAGNLNFFTRPSGAVPVRRLRIESWGQLTAINGVTNVNGNNGKLASGHCSSWGSSHMSGGLAVGWYPIIHLTDGCYLFLLKTGAHSSMLFTASNGYDPSNLSYINILHATHNPNSSYLNVDGLRATSDGVIEVHLNAGSADYFEMQCQVIGAENISNSLMFYSTLTKQTGSPTINDSKYPLTYQGYGGAMQVENLRVDGSFSKGSGSFRIPHPLPALKDTKDLAHSFIEGPQCDNIYRGKIDLVDGTATVNLDSASNMTEGTFVLLNRDVQCYTTNETGWTNIKGSVSGNTLTITAQDNSCTDTISWMVIGERQDDNIKSEKCAISDNDGNLIVEPDRFTNRGQAPDDSKPNLT